MIARCYWLSSSNESLACRYWQSSSNGPLAHRYWQYSSNGVTPYFSKRIEFYRFIYLNKYLFVAFYADAYFPLCCEVFLYFILRVEVVEIRIWIEFKLICIFILIFENGKAFLFSHLSWAKTQPHPEAAQLASPFSFSRARPRWGPVASRSLCWTCLPREDPAE
jgi:hypothetical protein